MPGGVNSPVRAFHAVGGEPLTLESGFEARVRDVDGNDYIDYVGSWGPLILGHAHPEVVEAVTRALRLGSSFGAPTLAETALARRLVEALPSLERVRLVNSGTEAAMSALRLARAATGRDLVVKCAGGYHGHADGLLVRAGSGATTLGTPDSPGVPAAYASCTLVARYNDLDDLDGLFRAYPGRIAAFILEPVAGNMGVVPPVRGYLEGVRELTRGAGALLVFDEVMTGFRVAWGGAQVLYGVAPDLTCLGKVIGGGLPVGAYGGRADLMARVAPEGPVYQAGTLSGNPLAVAAGLATLEVLSRPGAYERLGLLSERLSEGLRGVFLEAGVPSYHTRVGSMLCTFFTPGPVADYDGATASDAALYAAWFRAMLEEGVYLAPSQYEAAFVSLAHRESDIDATVEAAARALARCVSSS
ncbi:MAG: glutamate-1-semialdehyde 2,1-aminomutase [Planctomycetes bacterium]|nr:glutamate-1-semialdehyde 2,1-aminomutase [Planctomycetota bacterium]